MGRKSAESWEYQSNCCYKCGAVSNLHRHHIFQGRNRNASERFNLTIMLCGRHHNLSDEGIHSDKQFDLQVKRMAQTAFEERYGHEKFMEIIGRNYL